MSETTQPTEAAAQTPAGVYEHYCQHAGCTKWGSFGFARNQRDEPTWYCFEHRSDGA